LTGYSESKLFRDERAFQLAEPHHLTTALVEETARLVRGQASVRDAGGSLAEAWGKTLLGATVSVSKKTAGIWC
jgi:hypothetical protein